MDRHNISIAYHIKLNTNEAGAHCSCGWSETHDSPAAAESAAQHHVDLRGRMAERKA